MQPKGYVALHRKILENPIVCKDSDYFSIWSYLLLMATHTEIDGIFKGNRIKLKSGQLLTGRKSISKQFSINESKVQRVLKKLEIEQQIEQQTSTKNRLVTIVNWSEYQKSEQQNKQQVNNKRTTSEHKQECNKGNNERIDIYTDNLELKNTLKDFIKMRTKIKKPMTDKAITLLFNKLDSYKDDVKIKMLNNSILNNWASVYPLKDKGNIISINNL